MRLLLISNSTNAGEEYLSYTLPYIQNFIESKKLAAVFIPFAGVTITWNDYYKIVSEKLRLAGIDLVSIHTSPKPELEISKAELLIIGGGNTFNLLKTIQDKNLLKIIRKKIISGTPYIGWSAGSNITCPTICTTNDMPIVEPQSFNGLNLIPFQINPHYTDETIQNHSGETREMRINEFITANKNAIVAGLREGTMFQIIDKSIKLLGNNSCRIFQYGKQPLELKSSDDFSLLMQ